VKYNADPYLKDIINKLGDALNTSYYNMIIKAFTNLLANGSQHNDKINITFKDCRNISLENNLKEYKALCVYNMSEDVEEIFESVEFSSKKKKKGMRPPEFRFETSAKYFTRTPEFNVLIYNKKAEFLIRNKIFEVIVKNFETVTDHELDIDTKSLFLKFNEVYEEMVEQTGIQEKLLCLKFKEKEQEHGSEHL
jgi:hypothetical protein